MSANGTDGLAAIDAAIESGRVTATDPRERELQELALALSAPPPPPDPDFAARLDRRVREGFPRKRRFAVALRRPPLPVLAGGAAALLAGVVAVALYAGGDDGRKPTPALSTGGKPVESVGPAAREAAPVGPPGTGDVVPGRRQREIERSAELRLAAPGDRLEDVADGIGAVVQRHRGFVLRSSLSTGDSGVTGGSFDLRVPATELRDALRELSGLARIVSQSQSSVDVTAAFVSTGDRLAAAKAERRGLLRRLARARTDAEAEAVRERLRIVAGEINSLRGQLRGLREHTGFATVSVTLEQKDGDAGSGGSVDDGLDDALGTLADSLGLALRLLGVLIPLALVGGLAWLAAAAIRRRRREAALS
jgi:uncharacterized protein DUF4349